jgi:drug/metabolite transporter (DMT)-like permease
MNKESASPGRALAAHACAVAAFVLFGCTVLVVVRSDVAVVDLIFGRMAVTAAFLSPILLAGYARKAPATERGDQFIAARKTLVALAATSAAIFLNMFFLYHSFRMAPPSTCIAIFYCGPVLTTLLLAKVEGRRLGGSEVVTSLIVTASLAAYFLAHMDSAAISGFEIMGYACAVMGGGLFGLVPVLERGCRKIRPLTALAVQSMIAAVSLAPFTSDQLVSQLSSAPMVFLVLGGALTLLPFALWWHSTRISDSVSPFVAYADPLTTMVLSAFVLGEPPKSQAQIGLTVILACCGVYALGSRLKQQSGVQHAQS